MDFEMAEKQNSSTVICLTSDDEEEDVVFVSNEQGSQQSETSMKEMEIQIQDIRSLQSEDAAMEEKSPGKDLVNFIRTNFDHEVYSADPQDVMQAVTDRPYSVYLYVGVELGGGKRATFLLIGYFNDCSGRSVVKLLHTLHMGIDGAQNRDIDAMVHVVYSDAWLLVEVLRKYELPLYNIAAFYCNVPQPYLTRVIVTRLQSFSPKLLSLCSIPEIAERACQAGITASFSQVVDLITDIHRHYTRCPSVNDSLKEVFADAGSYNPRLPLSAHCFFITYSVQKMAAHWQDLQEYFKSLKETKPLNRIKIQLMDDAFRLQFLFLSHSLEPLRALQELQQAGKADLSGELQLAFILLQSYMASIYKPSVSIPFLKQELTLPQSENLLPFYEVNIGVQALELMMVSGSNIEQQVKISFLKNAQTFYKAALWSLLESIPAPLCDVTVRKIGNMLKNPESINKDFPWEGLPMIGAQLGLCAVSAAEQELTEGCNILKKEQRKREGCIGWVTILGKVKRWPTLHKLFLTLLALPSSLHMSQVFAQAYKNIKINPNVEKTPAASPQVEKLGQDSGTDRRTPLLPENSNYQKRKVTVDQESSEKESSPTGKLLTHKKLKHGGSMEKTDETDNFSDLVDFTEESRQSSADPPMTSERDGIQQGEFIFIVTSDEEEEGLDSTTILPDSEEFAEKSVGDLVWGEIDGFSPWPGIIVSYKAQKQYPRKRMVEWYGQRMCSLVTVASLKPFAGFSQYFCAHSFATLVTYREAILSSLQEAAQRCGKQFSALLDDSEELLKQMLDWAFGGFQPSGPAGLKPRIGFVKTCTKPKVKKKLFGKSNQALSPSKSAVAISDIITKACSVVVSVNKISFTPGDTSSSSKTNGDNEQNSAEKSLKEVNPVMGKQGNGGSQVETDRLDEEWENVNSRKERGVSERQRAAKSVKKSHRWLNGLDDDDTSPDFVPYRKRSCTKLYNKVNQPSSEYTQPDQKHREMVIKIIMESQLDIEDFCLCCGTKDIDIFHPLFKGGLCLKCKDNFTETLYRYDEDGYQSYCTICCYGMEVILCGHDGCHRSYCEDCLNILAGPGTFDSLKVVDPWVCYLCQPHQPHGALVPRDDWRFRVQELFANTSAMEFEPHRVYPSIPTKLRRPLRVLSLFDGIGTGYLVLKDLGFKVEKYVASEICEDSIAVASINHDGKIIHVGDVRLISDDVIQKWGPFDLLIGGSPCNDLSIVNPLRKGLYEGTGRLFFDYYRILQLLKPKEDDPRPFFWLFENVVFMNTHDKVNICRFLECNPVLVDAVKVSPANRARYFWGNIPGMSRPITASQKDKLNLQECLELGREARVTKVRTITTKSNSLKQGKNVSLLPVMDKGKEDILWITEVEKIFGFPKHYTDARNMNRQQRQKLLGKAWSVPVIRHLFAPLKEYFACEELPPVAMPDVSTSSSSATSSSPNSPDLQQLR
ncbi:DNA (cytosine-5)-methyltransferase 3B-like [Cyprinodon tularosa]|uniref:DNA (cytosine-5)-methyltransferase 3B-like n=1 Tax=Cyprinodon tularosa TaxID=77115 RepID=UPI0018E282A2|nr:DNA (cytosine-5)-methyltransferase 3B-like [Cyprinodon tularosa]